MKKVILANWGHAQQGKSDTLKRVAQKILTQFKNAVSDPVTVNFKNDITLIITINNTKIGIESHGDPGSILPKSLKCFSEKNCDIIICSTRTSGETVHIVNKIADAHQYYVIWVTNYRSENKNHQELNDLSANHIVDMIQRLMLVQL
ncbi:MAG: hypothetical protein ACOVOF_00655, partial [Chryseotalea sp.]|jgi:hypothetical protein|nr:hypothetical protein [Flammeovirgaceae bacterium]